MHKILSCLALAALALTPGDAASQSMLDLLQSIRNGGGWVRIDIEAGEGTLQTTALPTLGLTLRGCAQVYAGHSGRWEIRAQDQLGPGKLEADVIAGEPVHFSYATGPQSQLSVEARWSEGRDTTLLLWVGLESRAGVRDACVPVYGDR